MTVRKRIVVETDLEKRLPQTLGDRVQLQQVIFNLLLNGIEAMESVADRPKKLIIRSKAQSSNAILVEVRDHGAGVADSDKVFEAFYTTKEKGMGMGLSICRSIVEAHGGQLGIRHLKVRNLKGKALRDQERRSFSLCPPGGDELK